jgi:hypothetical protein
VKQHDDVSFNKRNAVKQYTIAISRIVVNANVLMKINIAQDHSRTM